MNIPPERTIRSALTKFRNVIFLARLLNALSRALVATMVILCLLLMAERIIPLPNPFVVGASSFLAVVVFYSVRARKTFAILPCALAVDRMFNLEERLSTAAETLSAGRGDEMSFAQLQDAGASVANIRCRPIFAKLTAGLARRIFASAGLAIFALSTFYIPSLGRSEGDENEILVRVTAAEASSIQVILANAQRSEKESPAVKAVISKLQKIIDSAVKGEAGAIEFSAELKRIREEIDALLASKSLTAQESALIETLAKQAGNASAAIVSELRRQGIENLSAPLLSNETLEKIERLKPKMDGVTGQTSPSEKPLAGLFHPSQAGSDSTPLDIQIRISDAVLKAMGNPDWPKQYDQAIRKYYSGHQ